MVASTRQLDHADHLTSIPDDENNALPVAAIYGANGAGKSNLVKALSFLESLVSRGTELKKPIGRRAFLLDPTSATKDSEFEVQFVEADRAYVFGCRVNDKVVTAEWLSMLREGKEIPVYERETNTSEEVTITAGRILNDGEHDKALALTKVGVLPNQLFLHAISKNLREQDQGPVLAGALRWFLQRLTIIPATATFSKLASLIIHDSKFTDFAGRFLQKVATGVDRLRVDTTQVDNGALGTFPARMQQVIDDLSPGETANIFGDNGTELVVEKGEGTTIRLRTLKSEHVTPEGARVTLPFSEESDGTQRLTHLLPALHSVCRQPGLFVIDEIDRSLHPLLAKGFVREFLKACAGHGCQLIFTTHETAFLDLDLLRRDEIWFAAKKQPEGTTELYSLADYKIRTDLKIDKAYLQGRFDAVPPIEHELPEWVASIMNELHPSATAMETTQ